VRGRSSCLGAAASLAGYSDRIRDFDFCRVAFWPGAFAFARGRAAFFFAAGLAVLAAAPDATRDECLARCRVFFGAASATEDSAKAAIIATTSIFNVLRIMESSSRSEQVAAGSRLR